MVGTSPVGEVPRFREGQSEASRVLLRGSYFLVTDTRLQQMCNSQDDRFGADPFTQPWPYIGADLHRVADDLLELEMKGG